jgi:ATP-dependent exoDNAse (exonuclease V) beta subunit
MSTVDRGEALVQSMPHRVVRASAGSGKTHRLAARYLEILFAGGRPEAIVAATFTREAAGEILGRVLTRLAAAAGDAGEARRLGIELARPDLDRRRCERGLRALCDALDRVVVSTLDSFFYRLTAALRFELGLPGVPAVAALDDPLLQALREEALEATLRSLAERDWRELVDLFERLHTGSARRSVARALDALLLELYEIYLEAPAAELWGRLESAPRPGTAAVAAAVETLDGFLRASAPGPLRRALADDLELARGGEWERLLERGLAGKLAGDPGATRFGAAAIPPPWAAALAVVVAHARGAIVDAQVARTRATHHLLDAFHGHYWALRRRRGLLLFSDLATGLERWLPQASAAGMLEELYFRVDARVGHLLLDEFQDTSLAQWSVLRPIAEEIRAWGDGSRTFFCVGDPKQAIYGWRGGCADLFDQIEDDLDLDPRSGERLDESFRSSQTVLDAVNAVFGGLERVDALAEHRETVAVWTAAFGPHRARLELPGFVELIESPTAADHQEWTASRVRTLAGALPDAAIAVLVHTNEQAALLLDALRRQGIEASGEGGGAVADDPAVAAVIAALVLADHPADTIAAFHVASCPLGVVVGLAGRQPAAAMAASRRLRRAFQERGATDLLAGWRRALRPSCDRRSRQRLAQAVDLAARFEREGGGRPGELADYLGRALVESPRPTGVRVMTVHRAKGLEFDVVVAPALERPLLRGTDAPVYLLRRSPLAPVDAVHRTASAAIRRLAPELEEGHRQERARRLRDDLSVLYVATTRARHALHLWVEPPSAGDASSRPVASYAAILRQTLGGAGARPAPATGGLDDGGAVLYRQGDLGAAAAAIASARAAARGARQASLPLTARPAPGERPAALRPAVSIEELSAPGVERAGEVLAGALGTPASPGEPRWGELETWLATGRSDVGALAPAAVADARRWLLADGRRLGRVERSRRFVCSIGATTVTGELPRVWIAGAPSVEPRAVVASDRADPAVLRMAAARALGLGERAVAVLVVGSGAPRFESP